MGRHGGHSSRVRAPDHTPARWHTREAPGVTGRHQALLSVKEKSHSPASKPRPLPLGPPPRTGTTVLRTTNGESLVNFGGCINASLLQCRHSETMTSTPCLERPGIITSENSDSGKCLPQTQCGPAVPRSLHPRPLSDSFFLAFK